MAKNGTMARSYKAFYAFCIARLSLNALFSIRMLTRCRHLVHFTSSSKNIASHQLSPHHITNRLSVTLKCRKYPHTPTLSQRSGSVSISVIKTYDYLKASTEIGMRLDNLIYVFQRLVASFIFTYTLPEPPFYAPLTKHHKIVKMGIRALS